MPKYSELGNAVNNAREVFRTIGYRRCLIPDHLWEDPECRPKIVRHLIKGIKMPEFLARICVANLAARMAEAPHSILS